MKGMVFLLLYGLPCFLARPGPTGLGGKGGKDMVGPLQPLHIHKGTDISSA